MNLIESSIKRFIQRLSIAVLLILVFNAFLLGMYIYRLKSSTSGEMAILPLLKQFPKELIHQNRQYHLAANIKGELDRQNMWSMLIDERSGNVVWSYRLPKEIPVRYSLSDVAAFSRYYLKDYPVATWKHPEGLIVVGSPKNSFWKSAYMVPDSEFKTLPGKIAVVLIGDLLIIFLLYLYIDRKSIKAVSNILEGIRSLSSGRPIQLKENGTFSEIADQLNMTSDLLETRKAAQENWIMGISHDVRTPLTVILGYAESIEINASLPEEVREKASVIKYQSIKLRDLVNDLNLITRLEDHKTIARNEVFQPVEFCREVLALFLNNGIPKPFSIELTIGKGLESINLRGNKHLLQRAIHNLLYNCIKHNPDGCNIHFRLVLGTGHILFIVSDDGKGIEPDEIGLLEIRSQYLTGSDIYEHRQKGFGLYIVHQIIKMHSGKLQFKENQSGGLDVIIGLPIVR